MTEKNLIVDETVNGCTVRLTSYTYELNTYRTYGGPRDQDITFHLEIGGKTKRVETIDLADTVTVKNTADGFELYASGYIACLRDFAEKAAQKSESASQINEHGEMVGF